MQPYRQAQQDATFLRRQREAGKRAWQARKLRHQLWIIPGLLGDAAALVALLLCLLAARR